MKRQPEPTEILVCPYCSGRFSKRSSFRRHVVLDECGRVPLEASCSMMATEGKTIREDEFQRLVMVLAERNGWMTCHVRRAIMSDGRMLTATSSPGFPDLTLCRPPQLVFLELKAERGRTSPEQTRWIRSVQGCDGVEAYIVKPSDWREILGLLTPKVTSPLSC